MFDIYEYVESKDEREYLKKIGYKFDSLSAAWVIDRNYNLSIKEKHDIYRKIIENMPDCPIKGGTIYKSAKSVHEKLKRIMEEEKDAIYDVERNFYKEYSFKLVVDKLWQVDKRKFDDFKTCFFTAKEEAQKKNADIIITATNNMDDDCPICLDISKDGQLQRIRGYFFYENDLFDLWVDIPSPFKMGDIVKFILDDEVRPENRFGPIVITYIPSIEEDEENCLYDSDMWLRGRCVKDDGKLSEEMYFTCTHLEFFKGEFTKKQEKLIPLSEAIKNFT